MILTYQKIINKTRVYSFFIIGILLTTPLGVFAAGLSLSVTPTLFEMSAVPSQSWQSSIKVINNNPQELTVYASVVNFAPQGENGQGKFLPVFEEFTEGKTLAEWITVSDDAFLIQPESSTNIPLQITIPPDASPGGHFAAILIGTKPPQSDSAVRVQTAQIVTSLFFVRIAGDVVENGSIRTFRPLHSFVDTPEIDFEVRFENKGNVHLQPQGEIIITNMWGKERGIVPINQQTHFGNVLPESIRKFNFTWKGEQSFTDIGRYKAVLTLAYGTDSRQFSTQTTHFWVVPIKSVLLVLGTILSIVFLITWSIKTYIRRMLALSTVQGYVPHSQRIVQKGDVVIEEKPSVTAPLKIGLYDLRSRLEHVRAPLDLCKTIRRFVCTYKKFFGGSILLIISGVAIWYFIEDVTTEQRDYEVTIDNLDSSVTVSSEEIIYEKSSSSHPKDTENILSQQDFELILINSSDTVGAAADLQKTLEEQGYGIKSLKSDFSETKQRTVIVYDVVLQDEALNLSKFLGGALLSARQTPVDGDSLNISIFIGNDYQNNIDEQGE
jgi:hypothetical protein